MRLVTDAEVHARLDPGRAVEAIREALRQPRPQAAARLDAPTAIRSQLVSVDSGTAALTICASRAADAAVLARFDADATLAAVFEADTLRRMAAGAACAVAAALLAPADGDLAVIGAGALAEATIRCLAAAGPARNLRIYSRQPEAARRLASRHAGRAATSVADAVTGAALIVTTTRARDPVLRDDWLGDGMLIAALGATRPDQRELDYRTLKRAVFVCCDQLDEARFTASDLTETISEGHLDWLEVHALHEVANGLVEGRSRRSDVVVYKSVGDAALVAALTAGL
jgi:ornithine cyclodeaminase/alanine dehydrogenase-like protein (mu-crystallin family)